jgi:hypothetical protein
MSKPDNDLLEAMRSLILPSNETEDRKTSRPREIPSEKGLPTDLEKLFLTPSQTFSEEWLNKLQQYPSYFTVRLLIRIEAGINLLNLIHYSHWEQRYHDHEFDS